jgi:TonB-linked SusC/RagA family outer membrane protein
MRRSSALCSLALTFGTVAPAALAAQGGSVAGTVVSRGSGAPVAAAQVTVAGTTLRALTDASGRFALNEVPGATAVLQVRMIGFRVRTDTVNVGDTDLRIALEPKALELERVVVTGTAAATAQRELGHTVSRINAAEVTQQAPINSVQDLLNGRAAGVLIQPATGAVGSGSRIRIRGASSLSLSNQPLVYVDGVRVDADFATGPQNQSFGSSSISRFNDFNPDDIESIEIVKGPAATTLYGTEASNGVIQIITKRGAPGAPHWNFKLRQGVNFLSNPEGRFATNYDTVRVSPTQLDTASITMNVLQAQPGIGDIFRTGHVSDYQVGVSGGSSAVRYYVAGGTELQGGAEASNDFRRSTGRANLTVTPSEQVTLSANLGYVTGPTHLSAEAGFGGRVWTTVLATPSNLGSFRQGFWSGLPTQYDQVYHFTQDLDRFTGSFQVQHHPVKWFTHRITFGVDRTREENSELYARVDALVSNSTFGSDALGYIALNNRAIDNTTADYAATASFELSPTLRSSTSGGIQFYHALTDSTFADGLYFAAAGLTSIDATTGPRSNAGGLEETKSIGAYGQEQITWRDRVFLTAGLRADQHSTFSPNFKRVYYPKASASWVLSDEPFWKYPFVNQLRLRAAYGESGRAPPYNAAVRVYRPVTGPGDVSAVTPQSIGNPNLEPERGKELELGFDAGLWNDRLGLEFTYYRKRTTNEILQREIAPSIGFPPVFPGAQYFNAGAVLNQGLELLARGRPYDRGPVSVDLSLNLSTNSNKIQSLLPGVTSVSAGTFLQHRVGHPVGSWFGRKVVSADLDATGTAINVLCDNGSGGTVACSTAPNVFLGRTIPNFEGAFNTTVTLWGRLRVSGLLDFKTGYRKMDGNTRVRCTVVGEFCRENFFPQEFDPKRIAGIQSGGTIVDYLIDDASFMKLREVSANYSLPDRWASAIGATRASVTLAGRNLHTWTRYGGLEPEAMFLGGTRGGNFSAWEQTDLPQVTQWVVTVNVDY